MLLRAIPASVGRWLTAWLALAASTRVIVEGESMRPALAGGDRLLVNRLVFRLRRPRRGEIVLLRDPARPGYECIKRIVALPGERVRLDSDALSVNGRRLEEPYLAPGISETPVTQEWRLDQGTYLVLGDNRGQSTDSRAFGPVPLAALIGPAWHRYRR